MAIENLFITRLNRRWIITFVFGLVHGFGFYGVLRDLHLSQQGLMLSLCAFNLGVEVGQVLLVTLCYPALALLARQGWQRQACVRPVAADRWPGAVLVRQSVPFSSEPQRQRAGDTPRALYTHCTRLARLASPARAGQRHPPRDLCPAYTSSVTPIL